MKKLIVVLFVLILSQNIFAQLGWQWVNPLPQGNNLVKIKFANPRIGYAVGDRGTVIKTTNGGMNWTIMNEGVFKAVIERLSVIDSNIVIISGGDYTTGDYIFKTTNGGDNWLYMGNQIDFQSINFVNANTGLGIDLFRRIFKTTNSGANWFLNYTFANSNALGWRINFLNTQTGFATFAVYPDTGITMVRTTDQGSTWIVCYSNYTVSCFSFINDLTGYGSCQEGKIVKTTNTGLNWYNVGNRPVESGIGNIWFVGKTGFSSDDQTPNGKIYRTTNEGATWNSQTITPGIRAFDFVSANSGFAVGDGGSILQTTNAGLNWLNTSFLFASKGPLFCVDFPDQNTGFIGGANGTVLKTTNQGLNWNLTLVGISTFKSIFFLNAQTGYIGGRDDHAVGDRHIYKTTNGGINWNMNPILFPDAISSIYFYNASTGFLTIGAYQNGYLYKTTDGGNNWIQAMHRNYNMGSIHFINSQIGYFRAYRETSSNSDSRIYKTTNGGNSWDSIFSAATLRITSVKFSSESTGYINVFDLGIFRTTNGGVNWALVLNNRYLSEVKLVGSNTVYSANYKSTNQGLNWYSYDARTDNINSVLFINESTGFIVGGLYTPYILKTTDGGTLTSINYEATLNQLPKDFLLHQNYPNPFNPSTKINYELRNSNYVSLKVFDLLGKEVATLVNEKQNAGSYAVDFNSTEFNLPSGIYFYTLNAGEFKETKKMVLVK